MQEIGIITVLGKQWKYTKRKGEHRAVLQIGYFSVVYYFPL